MSDKDRYVYDRAGEIQIAECQCEFCIHYNGGARSDKCPTELLERIIADELLCPRMNKGTIFDEDGD